MATRLIINKFDLNLPPLAAALLVIIIIVVGGAGPLALHASALSSRRVAVASRVRVVVELRGGGLLVLVCDVGHVYGGKGKIWGCRGREELLPNKNGQIKVKGWTEMLF